MTKLSLVYELLSKGADKAAADTDRVGRSAEGTGHKVDKAGGSMRLLADTFTGASNQALGPLQEIADKFDVIQRASESATSRAGGRLLGLGAAGLGVGSFLSTLASREQQGAQQLQASIAASGGSYEEFAKQIEAAGKAGEHFGYQNATTLDALNRLTLTTHSPAEALRDLAAAQDVAASKHESLAKAAEQVGLIYNGSTRAGKQFGLVLENTTTAAKALTVAHAAATTANQHVTSAQQAYNDKLAVYNQTLKPTLAQQLALYRSHQNVVTAQHAAADAAARLKVAQDKASDAAGAGARNVQRLADITRGQAEAAADSFSGHLRALGAQVEDTAGRLGEKWGSAINTMSLGTIAIGSLIETGFLPKLGKLITGFVRTGDAAKTLRDVEVTTSAEGAAAVEAGAAREVVALDSVGASAAVSGGKLSGMLSLGTRLGALAIPLTAFASALSQIQQSGAAAVDRAGDFGLVDAAQTIAEAQAAADALSAKATTLENKHNKSGILQIGKEFLGFASDPLDAAATARAAADKAQERVRELQAAANAIAHQQARDLNSDDPKIAARAAQTVARAREAAAKAAQDAARAKAAAGSPGTDQTLKQFLASMGLGTPVSAITQQAATEAARIAKQNAVDAATAIRDSIKTEFDNAKSVLTDVMNQAKGLRQSIAQSLVQGSEITDVFGTGPNLNANHAFGSGADFEKVKRFFADRLAKLRRFAAELSALVHKGLDPALVAQIAQAGIDNGGGRLADALTGSSTAQLGQIDTLSRQVTALADSAGKRISDVQYREQIAAAKKTNDILNKELKEANAHLRVISRTPATHPVDQAAAAFRRGYS